MVRFIHLKGQPEVDTAAVAGELCQLLPNSKVFPNSLMLDLTAAIVDPSQGSGLKLHKTLINNVVKTILKTNSTSHITWILVSQQPQSSLEDVSLQAYREAVTQQGLPFSSLSLERHVKDNKALSIMEMSDETSNVQDATNGHKDDDWKLDVTNLTQSEAAQTLYEYLDSLEPKVVPRYKTFADIPGFKHEFIRDLHKGQSGHEVHLLCWLVGRPRDHGAMLFLPVGDSSGTIQVVVDKTKVPSWTELKTLKTESSLKVSGTVSLSRGKAEIILEKASIISKSTKLLHPEIRKLDKDILANCNTDKVLANRHLYLRNPLILALNSYRSHFFSAIHEWFKDHQFVDISAPLITPSILYEPNSAIHLTNLKSNKTLFLSQCAGFYLEAAAHAHERVYNLGPSFRNESRTNRHLMEYWHIKAEICSGQMDDIMDLVEIFLRDISEALLPFTDELTAMMGTSRPRIQIPFPRITYLEAVNLLNQKNFALSFGQNISKQAENLLSEHFGGPLWITHKPRELEPFPYCICPEDDRLSMTADLISSGGFGEICGVAEKSYTREELETRMKEKGKMEQMDIYSWVLESRDFGMVPHTAFGMGFERVLRWFCGIPHVKDAIPFPRIFGREPIP